MIEALQRYWWIPVLRGVSGIMFGIAAFANPGVALTVLVVFFGAWVLVDGTFGVIGAIGGRKLNENWLFDLLGGVLGIVVGILTFRSPAITALGLLIYIAAWALVRGVIDIALAIKLRHQIRGEWLMVLAGLLSIAFALMLLWNPGVGAIALLWLIASYAIVFGVLGIVFGFHIRRLTRVAATVLAAAVLLFGCHKNETTTTTGTDTAPIVTTTVVDTTPTSATIATATAVLTDPDKQFVIDAATALLNEEAFAKTADAHAANVAVKAFAHLLVTELGQLNSELKDLAQKHGVTIATAPDQKTIAANDTLAGLKGKKFDEAFLAQIAADHVTMIALFDAEATVVTDDGIKQWVAKTLPTLHSEATKAAELIAKIGKEKAY